MSLVWPRPDFPEFCQALAPEYRTCSRCWVAVWATLQFRHEEELLAAVPKEQLIHHYRDAVLPQKVDLGLR